MYNDTPPAGSAVIQPAIHTADIKALFPTEQALAAMLDHTLLKPEATEAAIVTVAEEAAAHRFACAMVNPAWVPAAARVLAGTGVRIGTVIDFPLGASLPAARQAELRICAEAGALDLDVVLPVGTFRSGLHNAVLRDLRSLAEAAHGQAAVLKVILETSLLTDDEKCRAATLCVEAGADFVKTSTGFSTGGATAADVALLRRTVGTVCGVKASGGIRTLGDAAQMAAAGANRIGASASVRILEEYRLLQP